MQPDETNGGVNPTNIDIIDVKEGEQDPLDAITDPEELRKAAKANRAIASRYKKDRKDPAPQDPAPITKKEVPAESSEKAYSREELNLRLDGYTDQEVEFIVRNGGKKALADPNSLVSIAIKQTVEQRKAEQAASRTSVSSSGSSEVEVKYTAEQLSKMSTKELEAILPKAPQQ